MVIGFHHCWSSGVARRVVAIVLCLSGAVSAPALAQSPRPRPSATVSIHQIQVAFIGSGMLGGGTLSYRGAAYRFRLEGWGLVEWAYRALTLLEPSITSVASPISRASTARLAAGGLQATRAGVLCGCKMQMASIYDGRRT